MGRKWRVWVFVDSGGISCIECRIGELVGFILVTNKLKVLELLLSSQIYLGGGMISQYFQRFTDLQRTAETELGLNESIETVMENSVCACVT